MALRQKVYKIESFIAGGESAGDMQGASAAAVVSGSSIDSRTILDELRAIRRMVEPTSEITSKTIESFKAELAEAHKIRAELEEIYAAIERTKQEIATLHTTGFKGAQMVRVTGELDAIVQGTLEATDQILTAAESIDRDAGLLEAAVKSEQDRALASDIQEQVIKIFESCNFQDLTGQRITKVVNTLKFIEDRIVRMMEIWGGIETFQSIQVDVIPDREGDAALLNGPKINADVGHASQDDIDALFG
ncbi:MAG: protein phosphatase CheZ [Labrys sp. (in: a-proteobacteria)]